MNKMISPFVMVIFGATGDLTGKKLMPALFKMYSEGFLPASPAGGGAKFYLVGMARRNMSHEEFREKMRETVMPSGKPKAESGKWQNFAKNLYYQQGFFEEEKPYQELVSLLKKFDREVGACITRYFYLATPPQNYSQILHLLVGSKLAEGCGQGSNKWTRILIEKPFGRDADDAKALEKKLAAAFEEKQIYRIDHYLGKEAIQNIIAFRFANGIFEPIWNKDYIDHIQITMAETGGLEGRIGFYEGVGALRDVVQNHMLEMLALVAMEQPNSFSTDAVRDARGAAIKSLKLIPPEEVDKYVVRGQYGRVSGSLRSQSLSAHVPNSLANDLRQSIKSSSLAQTSGPARKSLLPANPVSLVGYREEKGVDPNSDTETFVALKLFVDTPRWAGIPWYLRTGKRLKKDAVEISLVFKQTCHILFKEIGCPEEGNILTLRVSPHEGIGVRFIIKTPGHEFKLKDVDMNFHFREVFGSEVALEAYERILEEVFRSDQMLFNRSDEMEGSWRIITPIIRAWEKESDINFPNYTAGSWGPKEAFDLIEKDGRKWVLK